MTRRLIRSGLSDRQSKDESDVLEFRQFPSEALNYQDPIPRWYESPPTANR